jgi:hypothetical protein
MKRPQKLAVMLVPTPPYEICGLGNSIEDFDGVIISLKVGCSKKSKGFLQIFSKPTRDPTGALWTTQLTTGACRQAPVEAMEIILLSLINEGTAKAINRWF